MKRLLIFFAVGIMLCSCGGRYVFLVQNCNETKRKFLKGPKWFPELSPLTVMDLGGILHADTTHYKIVVLYGQACSGCSWYMKRVYAPYMNHIDTTQVRMLFVDHNAGAMVTIQSELHRYGIYPDQYYYIRDSTDQFISYDKDRYRPNRLNNMVAALYDNGAVCTTATFYPQTFISDKHNNIKMAYYKEYKDDGTLYREGFRPMSLYDLQLEDLNKVDFLKIDTVVIDSIWYQGLNKTVNASACSTLGCEI